MNQIPEFKNLLEMVEETIKSTSDEILSKYPSEFVSNNHLKQIGKVKKNSASTVHFITLAFAKMII